MTTTARVDRRYGPHPEHQNPYIPLIEAAPAVGTGTGRKTRHLAVLEIRNAMLAWDWGYQAGLADAMMKTLRTGARLVLLYTEDALAYAWDVAHCSDCNAGNCQRG